MAEGTGLLRAFGPFLIRPLLSACVPLHPRSEASPAPSVSACVRVSLAGVPQPAPKSAPNAELAYPAQATPIHWPTNPRISSGRPRRLHTQAILW